MKSPEVKKGYQRINDADKFIRDAAAFIRQSHGKLNDQAVLTTLLHDILGLADNRPCFLPRVSGYSEREAK